ncbi:MAG: asparaginase [Chloroflexia bacterium]
MATPDPKHNPERNPAVLVEVTRGPIVESVHYGVVAVAEADGSLVAWAGNPGTVTYYRSACKPIQVIPFVESGGADHFGLTDKEIAVMCGSHGGEEVHVEAVLSILDKIGVGPDALACGAHPPLEKQAARDLERQGHAPTALHNNCSGKHSGMLALARFHGWPIGGYQTPGHPVQETLLHVISDFTGLQQDEICIGADGCGVCTFGVPVHNMAVSFARLADADYWPEPRRSAIMRVQRAITTHPEMVGFRLGNLDTDIMRAGEGTLLSKGGAEGVHCAARLPSGAQPAQGFALKILDGDVAGRARRPGAVEGLRQAGFLDEAALNKLEPYWMEEVRNRPGDVVGMVRPAFTLSMG